MSEYTTGEMAKLCKITVRTVQYYDSRNILVPSRLSEGGRRLYSEEDLQKLKVICFLREIGLSINNIGELLSEANPENVISILLSQQKETLKSEIAERQSQLDTIEDMTRELKDISNFSVESINDIAHVTKNKRKLRKIRGITLAVGILMEIIEVSTFILWVTKGIWLPFVVGLIAVIAMTIAVLIYYFNHTAYICPECHEIFVPSLKDFFFANHTFKTRKLKCSKCGHKGFCVETYRDNETDEKA